LRTALTVEKPLGGVLASGGTPSPRLRSLLGKLTGQQNRVVPAEEIDQYLDALEEPRRATLARLRQTILDILPEADQGISSSVDRGV